MSKAMRERRLMAPPVGVLTIALLLVVALAGSRFGQTGAQDASPVAGASECFTAPADAASMDEGTPEAAPAATPVDAAGADAVVAAATAASECLSGAGELPISNFAADAASVATYDDGRTSMDVTYMLGEYQYVAATWWFAGADLALAAEDLGGLAPEGDSVIISAAVADDAAPITFEQRSSVTESEVLTLHLKNLTGTVDAHYDLYSVPAPMDTGTPLAEGEVAATPTGEEAMGGELVGTLTVAAAAEEDLHLVGLPAGTYVLVNPNVEGSVATLTVAALDI